MKPSKFWKNFDIGSEVSVAGSFLYDALHEFHLMVTLENTDEVFSVLYKLSIGFERMFKVAIVLHEHNSEVDQEAFEKSLQTHVLTSLAERLSQSVPAQLSDEHYKLLSGLTTFYSTHRYGRFCLQQVYDRDPEKNFLIDLLESNLAIEIRDASGLLATPNTDQCRKHLSKLVKKIAAWLFDAICIGSQKQNTYTYELRSGSKAEKVFLADRIDFLYEEILWKELLIFLMNSSETSPELEFLRSIEPIPFDPGLFKEYFAFLRGSSVGAMELSELEVNYEELQGIKDRLEMIHLIGSSNVFFDEGDFE